MDHSPRFLALCEGVRKTIDEVSIEDVAEKIRRGEHFDLVDVREASEFQAGRIEGARHLGKGVIERDIEKAIPDPEAEIILYCGGGFRSALAAENLKRMGYQNVRSMNGGWRGWTDAKHPIDDSARIPAAPSH